MALPRQVEQQKAAAEEYDRQLAAQAAAAADPPQPANDDPQSPAPEPPAGAPANGTSVEDWEQKYRSLHGMIQREAREKQTLQQQLQLLQQRFDLTQQTKAPQAAPATPTPAEPLVSEKDVEAFGSDLIDMARRVAREEFGTREQTYIERIGALETQVKQQVGEVQQTQQHTSRETFFASLGREIPTWQTIQASEQCQQWLASRVPGAAFTWNDVLVNAAENFDVARAVEVFTTFTAAHTKGAVATPAAQTSADRARAELSRQVTPPRASGPTPVSGGEKRIISSEEYAAQSNQIIRLSKAGKYAEAAQIEQELNAALLEGRIRP